MSRSCGVVVITSALHAEGPQFDPGRDHTILFCCLLSEILQEYLNPQKLI